jgi:transglutaminase-like putative cysteine protease
VFNFVRRLSAVSFAFLCNRSNAHDSAQASNKYTHQTQQVINREVLIGLLFAQAGAIFLNFSMLPYWLFIVSTLVFIWRIQILRGKWSFPNSIVRTVIVVASIVAIVNTYDQWYSLEPMVTLLALSFVLILLEVNNQREAIKVVFIGYFVTSCAFLFEQGIVISLAGVLVLGCLTACLLVLNGTHIQFLSRRSLRSVTVLLLQALPLMLLMLFVFPRIGPLWSVPLKGDSAVTGVGNSMSPGDFSNLTRSRKLVFRVSFSDNKLPKPSERYWRGLVFSDFNGRRWDRAKNDNFYLINDGYDTSYIPLDSTDAAAVFNYEVILEPTNTSWLYALPLATINDKKLERTASNELWLNTPATQRIKYQVSSTFNYQVNEHRGRLQQSRSLPLGFNPKTIATAKKWRSEVATDEAYIDKVLQFYNQTFTYTLSPPKLGLHTVDEFLFSTQSGFCEHYASSFVVLMRAVGIPTRVVTGFQGGQWNAEASYLLVRQYDAHAWTEVWLEGKGWTRFDPTAAVAPSRIEQGGLLDTLSLSDRELLDTSALPSFAWTNSLSLKWDSLNYRWQRWVLSYDQKQQSRFLKDLLGEVTSARMALLLIAPAIIMLLVFSFYTLKNATRPVSREAKLYKFLCKRFKHQGITINAGDTFNAIFIKAHRALPSSKAQLVSIESDLNAIFYSEEITLTTAKYRDMKRKIKRFKR